eukprot:2964543-Alexandrium_andersonii.AAC.1
MLSVGPCVASLSGSLSWWERWAFRGGAHVSAGLMCCGHVVSATCIVCGWAWLAASGGSWRGGERRSFAMLNSYEV